MLKQICSLFMISLLTAGCMHRIPVNPDVRPGLEYEHKLPGPYAVCILPEFENYVYLTKGTSTDRSLDWAAGLQKYSFKIGPAATSAIVNAVHAAVDSVVRFSRRPTPAEMDSLHLRGYFLPYFKDCQLVAVYDPETTSNSYWVGITLGLNFYDRFDSLCFNCKSAHDSQGIREKFMESEWKTWVHGAEYVLKSISRDFAEAIISSNEIRKLSTPSALPQ